MNPSTFNEWCYAIFDWSIVAVLLLIVYLVFLRRRSQGGIARTRLSDSRAQAAATEIYVSKDSEPLLCSHCGQNEAVFDVAWGFHFERFEASLVYDITIPPYYVGPRDYWQWRMQDRNLYEKTLYCNFYDLPGWNLQAPGAFALCLSCAEYFTDEQVDEAEIALEKARKFRTNRTAWACVVGFLAPVMFGRIACVTSPGSPVHQPGLVFLVCFCVMFLGAILAYCRYSPSVSFDRDRLAFLKVVSRAYFNAVSLLEQSGQYDRIVESSKRGPLNRAAMRHIDNVMW